jgi:hypothetical protein
MEDVVYPVCGEVIKRGSCQEYWLYDTSHMINLQQPPEDHVSKRSEKVRWCKQDIAARRLSARVGNVGMRHRTL